MTYRHIITIDGDEWRLKESEAQGFVDELQKILAGTGHGLLTISDGVVVDTYLINGSTKFRYRQEPEPDIQNTFA